MQGNRQSVKISTLNEDEEEAFPVTGFCSTMWVLISTFLLFAGHSG